LAPRMMPLLTRHIVATTDEALDALQVRIDKPVNLLETMQNLTLEIAGRSMFSLEMARYGNEMRRMLTEYGEKHARPSMLDLLLPPSIPTPGDFGRRRFHKRWMALIEAIMRDRLATPPPEQPRDLFDLLRAARDPETGAGFSPDQLRDQVATLILAGHETTAVSLFWALTLLAQDPDEQQKLANDLDVRCRSVLNETLRLFPAAFLIVREAIGPDQAGTHKIARGDLIMIAPWILHRHKNLWRDPDAFDPSRFLPDVPPPPRFSYLPFGAGPRICVGAQFALTEATIVLAAFVKRFEVTLESTGRVLPVGIVTTQPDHPPAFRLRLR
jgi:cytochrome P450